jgi:hypothetical protein
MALLMSNTTVSSHGIAHVQYECKFPLFAKGRSDQIGCTWLSTARSRHWLRESYSQECLKLHPKRVEKMWNYSRNEWWRCETTPETSGEDVKLHSKREENMWNYSRNECRRCDTTLETSGEDVILHSKRVENWPIISTSKVWLSSLSWYDCCISTSFTLVSSVVFTSYQLVSSVVSHLLHSFGV